MTEPDQERLQRATEERKRLWRAYPEEFNDGGPTRP